jgi:hypothetical protein
MSGWSSGRFPASGASLCNSGDRTWSTVDMPQCQRRPLRLFAGTAVECVAPATAVALRLARGQIGYLRSEISAVSLLLMARIQSGNGAARTDAEDEEH